MDTSRTPLSPGGGVKRRRTPPTNEYGIPSAHHSQTSLPSFKQLEPYLRPQHISSEPPPSSYPYSGTSLYASHAGQQDSATSSQLISVPQRDSGIYGAGDSEADEVDHHSPPKKKRRRQALSCTGDLFFFTLLVTCPLSLTFSLSLSLFSPFRLSLSIPVSLTYDGYLLIHNYH